MAVLATALLFSTGGAGIKATALSGVQVAGLRAGIAALAFLAMVPAARRVPSGREWLVGCAYAGSLVLYTLANKLTTAASTIFLQSTAPLYILFLGPWLLRERIKPRDLLFLAAAGGGLSLFFLGSGAPQASAPDPLLGNLLGLASGLCWALTLVGLRWLGSRPQRPRSEPTKAENVSAVLAGNALAFLVCLPWTIAVERVRLEDWMVMVWLGVFQVAFAYVLLTAALKDLPAFEVSILLLFEPVLNPVWAWIVHGERPGPWAILGGAILLSATLVRSRFDARAGAVTRATVPRAPDRS